MILLVYIVSLVFAYVISKDIKTVFGVAGINSAIIATVLALNSRMRFSSKLYEAYSTSLPQTVLILYLTTLIAICNSQL